MELVRLCMRAKRFASSQDETDSNAAVPLYWHSNGAVPKWPKGEVCKTSIRGFNSHPRLQDSAVFARFLRAVERRVAAEGRFPPNQRDPAGFAWLLAASVRAAVRRAAIQLP